MHQRNSVLARWLRLLNVVKSNLWPGERDSNPRRCDPQRFSRPPLSTTQPSPDYGGDTQIRTGESRLCRPMPYRLAMSPTKQPKMVPRAGLEPARTQCPRDFKSLVSTIPPPGLINIKNLSFYDYGAGDGDRTRGPNLGKVVLYHWATPAN